MKTIYSTLIIIGFIIITSFTCANSINKKKIITKNNDAGFAVIELFTSEGCSSCPPADAAVARILQEYNHNVFLLGYHVDYWDNLGWKDIFSNGAYSKRQTNYAPIFKLSSVYTPQVIVNGEQQFVGSDENKLHNAINKDLKQISNQTLSISAKNKDDKTVEVSFKTNNTNNQNINVALIQSAAESQVKRGENSGTLLHHVNVVRDFKTVAANLNQNISLQIPGNLSSKDCFVIAFVQDAKTLKISAAAKAEIN